LEDTFDRVPSTDDFVAKLHAQFEQATVFSGWIELYVQDYIGIQIDRPQPARIVLR
jgi:hypothetical protein